jgi:hypothetical protein
MGAVVVTVCPARAGVLLVAALDGDPVTSRLATAVASVAMSTISTRPNFDLLMITPVITDHPP